MATNKPQLPKGKGRGRYDKTHQIALLTDFEVQALNHLRWKEKDRGESSGSGELIREIAAKNSRPFSFVDYKGEKIPTLNDSSSDDLTGSTDSSGTTTYSYSGGGDSGGGGESNWAKKKRLAYEKKQREEKAEKKRLKDIADKKEAKEKYEKKEAAKKKKAADIKAIHAYLAELKIRQQSTYKGQDSEELDYQEQDEESELTQMREDDEAFDEAEYGYYEGEEEVRDSSQDDPGTKLDDDDDDDGGLTEEEFIALTEEHGIETFTDSEGGIHLSQDEADAANVGFGKTKKIGTAEGFEYGTAVTGTDEEGNAITDEEGNVITTDKSLTGTYKGAYETLLADAYDAAKTGVGSATLGSGQVYEDPYVALENAVAGQNTYLDTLSSNYQSEAQGRYDDWLSTNTTAINALTDLGDIQNYAWTDMPEYDKDWSGGYVPGENEGDPQVWDENWMPDFYSGFNKEYGKDYLGPDSWKYDDQGNLIPGSYEPNTTGTTDTTVEGDDGSALAPSSRMAPGIQPGKKGATGVAQYGRSAAKYI